MTRTNHPEWEKIDSFDELKDLQDSYSNDTPDKMVGGSEGGPSKVRKNWWTAIIGNICFIIEDGVLPKDISNEAQIFVEKFNSEEFYQRQTTAEDITEANNVINRILKAQEESLNQKAA